MREAKVAGPAVELRNVDGGAGAVCRAILDLLPTWFGVPEANENYVQVASTHPSVITSAAGDDVGIIAVKHHSPYAAEAGTRESRLAPTEPSCATARPIVQQRED